MGVVSLSKCSVSDDAPKHLHSALFPLLYLRPGDWLAACGPLGFFGDGLYILFLHGVSLRFNTPCVGDALWRRRFCPVLFGIFFCTITCITYDLRWPREVLSFPLWFPPPGDTGALFDSLALHRVVISCFCTLLESGGGRMVCFFY